MQSPDASYPSCSICGQPVYPSDNGNILLWFINHSADISAWYNPDAPDQKQVVAHGTHIRPVAGCRGIPPLAEILFDPNTSCPDSLRISDTAERSRIRDAYRRQLDWLTAQEIKDSAPPIGKTVQGLAAEPALDAVWSSIGPTFDRSAPEEPLPELPMAVLHAAIQLFDREMAAPRTTDLTLTLTHNLAVTLYYVSGYRFARIHPIDKPELELASLGLTVIAPVAP
jgi:hypothetical protein